MSDEQPQPKAAPDAADAPEATATPEASAPNAETAKAAQAPAAEKAPAPSTETAQASAAEKAPASAAKTATSTEAVADDVLREEEAKEKKEEQQRSDFGAMLDEFSGDAGAATDPEVGSKVKGKIIQIGEDTSFVDFGGRSEGSIETQALKNKEGEVTASVGDEVEFFVLSTDDGVVLGTSYALPSDAAVSALADAKAQGLPVSGKVSALNSGGLEVSIGSLRAFCPFSQIELGFCPEPSVYLGQTLDFLVQEIAEGGKKLVVSRRALLRREQKGKAAELLKTLAVGQMLDGKVSRIQPFGAFIDIGGLDGLVHVSEIAHGRVNHPNDVLKEGQDVRVKVLSIEDADKKKRRISLSIKAGEADPWDEIAEQYWEGKKTSGTVVRMQPFGAFVELTPGIDGLVHVSEIAHRMVRDPKDVLEVGQRVEVSVLKVDPEKKRISLSIKALLPMEEGQESGGSGGGDGARPPRQSPPPGRLPEVGAIAAGVVRNIKDFGIFVDLPSYGHRISGLVPGSETGEPRGTDLSKKFNVGDNVKVAVINVDSDKKIRLSLTAVQEMEDRKSLESYQQTARKGSTAMEDAFRKAMGKAE